MTFHSVPPREVKCRVKLEEEEMGDVQQAVEAFGGWEGEEEGRETYSGSRTFGMEELSTYDCRGREEHDQSSFQLNFEYEK